MRRSDVVSIRGDGSPSKSVARLTDLPDEILLNILNNCQGVDILNLTEAFINSKLTQVIRDPSLWRNSVIGPGDIKKYIKYLGSYTETLTIIGSTSKPKASQRRAALSESVVSSICLRCTNLRQFTIQNCIIDNLVIRFSLFPKSITDLKLDNVTLINMPTMRCAIRSSPFFCIKKSLPKLQHLSLIAPSSYLGSYDSLALISGCELKPSLRIEGEDHHYSFEEESSSSRLTREARRDTSKLFGDLVMYHYIKKRYDTRQKPPT